MGELLADSLWLTVVGMGMTFAALGTLVLGMYLMTTLFREKRALEELVPAVESIAVPSADDTARYRAAAAAVAVALAQVRRAEGMPLAADEGDVWGAYVRSRQLTQSPGRAWGRQ